MKLHLSAVLLLLALLATDTEADWVREVGDVTKHVTEHTIRGIIDIVRGNAFKILGKRSVDFGSFRVKVGNSLPGNKLINQLDQACARLPDSQRQGLTPGIIKIVFGQTDENKDGSLNGNELGLFGNVLDAVGYCSLKKRNPFPMMF